MLLAHLSATSTPAVVRVLTVGTPTDKKNPIAIGSNSLLRLCVPFAPFRETLKLPFAPLRSITPLVVTSLPFREIIYPRMHEFLLINECFNKKPIPILSITSPTASCAPF